MKGLLMKDFKLLAGQKQYFISIFLVAALLLFSGQHISFVLTYMTMLCVFFTISTVSYDEHNNGYAFLFTLPVSRRGYVVEKYLFGLLAGCIGWAASMCMALGFILMRNPDVESGEWIAGALSALLTAGFVLSFALPMQLKFGAEKSRIISLIFVAAAFGFFAVAAKVVIPHWDMQWMQAIGTGGWLALGSVFYAALLLGSVLISIRIMEKKQF